MRLKLYEDAIRAKTKTSKGDKSIDSDDSDDGRAEAASPTRETPVPAEDRPDMEADASASQGGPLPRPPTRAVKSTTAAAPMVSPRPMPSRQGLRWFIRLLKDFGKKPLS